MLAVDLRFGIFDIVIIEHWNNLIFAAENIPISTHLFPAITSSFKS